MAKKAQQAYRGGEPPRQWPAWVWLSAGVALGLVLSAIVLVKDWLPALRSNDAPQPNPAATAARAGDAGVAAEAQKPAETKPKYDFYSVLPEMEVVVPDAEITAKAQAQPTVEPNPTATPEKYLLQAGSFRAGPDAEEMKAKLALLGLRAGVVAVTIDGTTWHRVRVGPYATARELDEARRTLSANGIEAIALREKQ